MISSTNPYRNVRVEFHILQSFPATCLNRDELGMPKSANVGGALRARVSSQCWKREVRLALRDFGASLAVRSKNIGTQIAARCQELGANEAQAKACGQKIEAIFNKDAQSRKDDEDVVETEASDTLLFVSPQEISDISLAFKDAQFKPEMVIRQDDPKKQAKEIEVLLANSKASLESLDLALFGRMIAQATKLNMEAAASFAHAISTHSSATDFDFFTALDDLESGSGAAHMGSTAFNSATYYRYIRLDLGQLWENLGGKSFEQAIAAFVKALYVAVPNARQTTFAGASPWGQARVFVRRGHALQVPFDAPVKASDSGFLAASAKVMNDYLDTKRDQAGSLFGQIADLSFGLERAYSVDSLIADIQKAVKP